MGQLQCPICYSPLEIRDVSPCFVCGGWPEIVTQFDSTAEYREFRLPDGKPITLCRPCILEEFMVDGGYGYQLFPKESLPIDALQLIRIVPDPKLIHDKFCTSCNRRLALIEILFSHLGNV